MQHISEYKYHTMIMHMHVHKALYKLPSL